jgi:hypothetical protein
MCRGDWFPRPEPPWVPASPGDSPALAKYMPRSLLLRGTKLSGSSHNCQMRRGAGPRGELLRHFGSAALDGSCGFAAGESRGSLERLEGRDEARFTHISPRSIVEGSPDRGLAA